MKVTADIYFDNYIYMKNCTLGVAGCNKFLYSEGTSKT